MNSIVSAIGSAASQPAGCFVQIIIQVDANNERFSRMIMSVPPSLLEMLPKNPLQMITNGPSLDTLEENFFPSSSGISEFLASVFSGNVHPLVLVVVVVLVLFFISGEEVNLNSLFDLELDANFFQSLLRPQKSSVPVEEKDLDFEVIPPKNVDEFEAIRSKLWKDDVSDLVLKSHSEDGVNGVYFLKNAQSNEVHSVFKPKDEEAFAPENPKDRVGSLDGESPLKSGVFVGDAYKKEVAAYLLDHDNFAGVPETNFASFSIKADSKVGSLQAFVANDGPSEDFSSNKFSVKDVHAIGLLDARIANLDRHAGNMLVKKATGDLNLIPIDHGYSLPDYRKMKDLTFEWSMWKHAAVPFDDETKYYVERIDVMTDARMLKSVLEMRDESVVTYVLCSTFVKEAVRKGWTLKQIGEFMQRDLINDESPSKFEILISKSVEESKFSLGSGDLLSSPEMTSLLECFHQAFAELS